MFLEKEEIGMNLTRKINQKILLKNNYSEAKMHKPPEVVRTCFVVVIGFVSLFLSLSKRIILKNK